MKKTIQIILAATIVFGTTINLEAAFEITPRLKVGTAYTDNVGLVAENPDSDYITTITPGITVAYLARTGGLTVSYDPSFVTYYDKSFEDYWSHAANLAGWWQSGRNTRFDLSNSFLRSENPISDVDLTIRPTRNPYTRNDTQVGVEHRFGANNLVNASFRYGFLENEDPQIDDSQSYVPSLGMTYWLNNSWGFDFTGTYTRGEYDVPVNDIPDDFDNYNGRMRLLHRFSRTLTGFVGYAHTYATFDNSDETPALVDYTIHEVFTGFDYDIDSTTYLSLTVGYFVRDLEDVETSTDDPAVPVNLDFTKTFQRGSLAFNIAGGYNYTVLTAENLGYYIFYGGGLNADYQFTRRITGDIFGLYEWRDYRDDPTGREDDIYRAGCGLSFQLFRWLTMRADYTHRVLESTNNFNDYKENSVALMFTLEPPQPYRF